MAFMSHCHGRVRAVERQVLANEDSHAAREGQYARSLIRLEQQMPVSDVGNSENMSRTDRTIPN